MPKRQSSSSSSQQSSESEAPKFISVQVSKLTPNVTQQHLLEIFTHFGTVKGITLTKSPKLSSTALLQFQKKQDAQLAITYMNKGYIDGSKISVEHESQAIKTQKPPQKKKSLERPPKRKSMERQRRRSRSRSKQDKDRRMRQRQSRNRRQRYNQRRESSSSSSSAVSSSNSSSGKDSSHS